MQNFPYLLTLNEVRVLDHFLLIFIIKGADFVHVIRNNGYLFYFQRRCHGRLHGCACGREKVKEVQTS